MPVSEVALTSGLLHALVKSEEIITLMISAAPIPTCSIKSAVSNQTTNYMICWETDSASEDVLP